MRRNTTGNTGLLSVQESRLQRIEKAKGIGGRYREREGLTGLSNNARLSDYLLLLRKLLRLVYYRLSQDFRNIVCQG